MMVRMGKCELELGGRYLEAGLRCSNDILYDTPGLRARMSEDGYLFLRGIHNLEQVRAARLEMLQKLADAGKLDPQAPLEQGRIRPDIQGRHTLSHEALAGNAPQLKALVEGRPIMGFFERFLGGPVLTFDYKWPRAIPPNNSTPIHYDIVYMGRGTTNLYTCWTPLDDVPLNKAPLALCLGSHRFERIKQTYGRMDVDRDLIDGSFSTDPVEIVDKFGGRWATSEFRMGDVVLLSMFILHGALANATNEYRLSVDTRYQPAREPVDERWVGAQPKAHYASTAPGARITPIEEARAQWGV